MFDPCSGGDKETAADVKTRQIALLEHLQRSKDELQEHSERLHMMVTCLREKLVSHTKHIQPLADGWLQILCD